MGYREDEAKRLRDQIENGTYVDRDGCLRWEMGNAVPHWTWRDAYGSEMPDYYRAAYDRDAERTLAAYRESEANRTYSDEELYEMRAAFGEGEEVVNVFTGRKTKL